MDVRPQHNPRALRTGRSKHHVYEVTALGKRVCLFFSKVNARVIRPGLSQLFDGCPKAPNRPLAAAINQLDRACEQLIAEAKLAA